MKRILAILLALMALTLPLSSCEKAEGTDTEKPTETITESPETDAPETGTSETKAPEKRPDITAECVLKKGNRYVIVLPESNKSIPVDNSLVKYLSSVTDELVAAAEAKISAEVKKLGEEPDWRIEAYENKEICLVVEVIVFKEGADYMEEQGCGIDHDHVFFAESLIPEQ